MIRGVVNARLEAIVRIRVPAPGNPGLDIDAVVDSGFNGSLTLPDSTVVMLGLPKHSSSRAELADGSLRQFDTYTAEISWDGAWRSVIVSTISVEALLGLQILAGHELRIAVVPGGAVEIVPIP